MGSIAPSLQPVEQTVINRETTEIPVFFPTDVVINLDNAETSPITLLLVQELLSSDGDVIAPANSLVRAQINPSEDGLHVVAESILVSGQSIPLDATSALIPGTVITTVTSDQNGQREAIKMRDIAGGIAGALGADLAASDQASFGGGVLGFLMGSSSSRQVREVTIPAGTIHILELN